MSRDIIEAWHKGIPPLERDQPLIILDEVAYTPNQVLKEVRDGTATGERMQEIVEKRKFTPVMDKYSLSVLRLKERLAKTAPGMQVVVGTETFTPEQLLREVQEGTRVGRALVEAETRRVEEVLIGRVEP